MSESGGVVLGVERSLTGKRWEASPADDRVALALSQRHNLSDIVAAFLSRVASRLILPRRF